ncbi:MAG TPA: hypothetical protein VMV10_08450 [Pirellulales bacterium]|nr:hypothetical protein [Pirellulales bacterium]
MNKYESHVFVIPEDDANRQIAEGFVEYHEVNHLRIRVMPVAGGWANVLVTFQNEYVRTLRNFGKAHIVMLIDFDDQVEQRRARFEEEIPEDVKTRVFVIGSKYTPEALKKSMKIAFEKIGESLAGDCRADTAENWSHEQLEHNETERQRLVETVKPFLFGMGLPGQVHG